METTTTGPAPNKFPFNDAIQRDVLGMLLYDQEFTLKEAQEIKPEHFRLQVDQDLARIILKFCAKYGRRPSNDELLESICRLIETSRIPLPPEIYLEEEYPKIALMEGKDFAYVRDQIRPWIRHESLRVELSKQIHLWDKGDDEAVLNSMKETTVSVGTSTGDLNVLDLADVERKEIEWFWH